MLRVYEPFLRVTAPPVSAEWVIFPSGLPSPGRSPDEEQKVQFTSRDVAQVEPTWKQFVPSATLDEVNC